MPGEDPHPAPRQRGIGGDGDAGFSAQQVAGAPGRLEQPPAELRGDVRRRIRQHVDVVRMHGERVLVRGLGPSLVIDPHAVVHGPGNLRSDFRRRDLCAQKPGQRTLDDGLDLLLETGQLLLHRRALYAAGKNRPNRALSSAAGRGGPRRRAALEHQERDERALVPKRNSCMWWLRLRPNRHRCGSLLRARRFSITLPRTAPRVFQGPLTVSCSAFDCRSTSAGSGA
jgi:hypothetical protein